MVKVSKIKEQIIEMAQRYKKAISTTLSLSPNVKSFKSNEKDSEVHFVSTTNCSSISLVNAPVKGE